MRKRLRQIVSRLACFFARRSTELDVCLVAYTLIFSHTVSAQVVAPPSQQKSMLRETSVTLAQIVFRQMENYRRIRTASGQVVWREELFTTASSAPPLRVIQFAFDTTGSVNLIVTWDGKTRLPRQKEKLDWGRVLAATYVSGEDVIQIHPPKTGETPTLSWAPFNPDVHGRNPLVRFHPALLGDEQIALADLVRAKDKIKAIVSIAELGEHRDPRIRVSFTNPEAPNELLYYIINPQKGYLPEFIARYSGNRCLFQTSVVIGRSPAGVWVPSRRMRIEYDASGRVARSEQWYYLDLSINEALSPYQISLAYFHLPPSAFPQRVQTNAPRSDNFLPSTTKGSLKPNKTQRGRITTPPLREAYTPSGTQSPRNQERVHPIAAPLPTPQAK